jgi:hypothetical protein
MKSGWGIWICVTYSYCAYFVYHVHDCYLSYDEWNHELITRMHACGRARVFLNGRGSVQCSAVFILVQYRYRICNTLHAYPQKERFTKRLKFVLIDRSWDMATSRYSGMPVSESRPLVHIRPLPRNLPYYVRRVRMCTGTCRDPNNCTFAHNEFELNQWNIQLQQGTTRSMILYHSI